MLIDVIAFLAAVLILMTSKTMTSSLERDSWRLSGWVLMVASLLPLTLAVLELLGLSISW